MTDYFIKASASSDFLSEHCPRSPKLAIVLGTGLSSITSMIHPVKELSFEEIPHFSDTSVPSHKGSLIIAKHGASTFLVQSGRCHYYEGFSMKEVTFPIRVYGLLGVERLIIINAVGGIHENFEPGEITIVQDHINLFPENPLRGINDSRFGPRFPDMSEPYSKSLIAMAHKIAKSSGLTLYESIYAGVPGPNLETRAEYKYLHNIGATVVGMSTIPEIIVANQMSIEACVFTAVTNQCFPIEKIQKTSANTIIENAEVAASKIQIILNEMIPQLL